MEVQGVNAVVGFDGGIVSIRRVGFLARATLGKGEKRLPVSSISSIQLKPAGAVVNGFIEFSLPGGNERQSQFGRQSWDQASNENAVMFTRQQQPEFEALRDAIERVMIGGPQAYQQQGYGQQQASSGLPPAGWYGDPSGEPMLRWWTGSEWTGHTHPVAPPGAAGSG